MKISHLDDKFFSRLETLALNLRSSLAGYFGGKHLVNTYGQTVEFADYREYQLGDDIRRIDWNLYSRFEKHYLKLFGANAIAVLSLLPCAYFIYLLIQTGDVVFWVVGLALFALASPCQTGLHSVCVRLVHRMPVWVKDEFINAWKQEWKPSMLLGLILGVLWSVLAYGAYMVVAVDGGMSVGYLLMMLLAAYFLTGLTLFGYQQIAMLELPFGTQLKNAALLIFAGKLRAFFAIVVWVGMLLVPVIYYGLAAYILLAGWVAIGVMTANVIFAPVFSRLFLTGEQE